MRRSLARRAMLPAIALALTFSVPAQGQDINTTGGSSPGAQQLSQSLWWGQTFTVPTARTFLNSVSFEFGWQIAPSIGASGMFNLQKWSAGAPSGSTLFTTPFETLYETGLYGNASSWTLTTFNVNLNVQPGDVYVAYLQPVGSGFSLFSSYADNYSGGSAVSQSVPFNSPGLGWTESADIDLGFQAVFSSPGGGQVVPEPATVMLLATGFLGLGGVGLRRRRKRIAQG